MKPEIILLLLTILIPFYFVFTNRLRMDVAALLIALLLAIYQLAGLSMVGDAHTPEDAMKAFSGFSQPVILTLVSLFIMTGALEKSGFPRWMARRIIRMGNGSVASTIGLLAAASALLSLFMNNLAAAALLLPGAIEVSRQANIKPSKLLIPIAYGSLLGGAATYFTTANILVSDLLTVAQPPQSRLGILDFTPTGGLIAIAGILFLRFAGDKILPDRESTREQNQVSITGSQLEDYFQIGDRLWQGKIYPDSSLAGKTIREAGFGEKWGISIAAIKPKWGEYLIPYPETVLTVNDTLLLVGREEKIDLIRLEGMEIQPENDTTHLSQLGISVVEIIMTPQSQLLGSTLKEINFRQRYGLTILGIRNLNRSYRTDVGDFTLNFGDSLLVIGNVEQIKRVERTNDFVMIEPNGADQPLKKKTLIVSSLGILGAVLASLLGVPIYVAMLAGALFTLLLGGTTMEEGYQSIHWQAIFMVAGMYAVSLAMIHTGLAAQTGETLLRLVRPLGGLGLASGAYILTAALTQIVGGQVTAMITAPITISAAISMGVDPHAIAVATAIGCSASFLTPMAHPVNILMIGPGNYEFSDFLKAGWVLTILTLIMLLVGMVLFWGL